MAAPTPAVRHATVTRDNYRCVLCNAADPLEWNHRANSGMGGSQRRPGAVEGVILCHTCNHDIEAHESLMKLALSYGVKIRKWANPELVPVYYAHEFSWFILSGTTRRKITPVLALDMMHAVYGDDFFRFREG